jgi:hypothetical protein
MGLSAVLRMSESLENFSVAVSQPMMGDLPIKSF